MELYSTEEQQAEALQEFWKKNGKTILLGIFVGVCGILGWQWFQKQQVKQMEEDTSIYMVTVKNLTADYNENTIKATENLINSKTGTIYADMAAFNLATLAIEKKLDYDKATTNLQISAKSKDDALANISKLRLARVYAQQGEYAKAEQTLYEVKDELYKVSVLEFKGDLLLLQGKQDEAKSIYSQAYDLIKDTESEQRNPLLKMKLDDVSTYKAPVNAKSTEKETEVVKETKESEKIE